LPRKGERCDGRTADPVRQPARSHDEGGKSERRIAEFGAPIENARGGVHWVADKRNLLLVKPDLADRH